MQEETRHSRALYEVAAAINSSLDPASVLSTVVQKGASAMGAKGCSMLLLTPDRSELHHSADYGLSERYVMKGPVRMDPDLAVCLDGEPVTILDVSSDPRIQYPQETIGRA